MRIKKLKIVKGANLTSEVKKAVDRRKMMMSILTLAVNITQLALLVAVSRRDRKKAP